MAQPLMTTQVFAISFPSNTHSTLSGRMCSKCTGFVFFCHLLPSVLKQKACSTICEFQKMCNEKDPLVNAYKKMRTNKKLCSHHLIIYMGTHFVWAAFIRSSRSLKFDLISHRITQHHGLKSTLHSHDKYKRKHSTPFSNIWLEGGPSAGLRVI